MRIRNRLVCAMILASPAMQGAQSLTSSDPCGTYELVSESDDNTPKTGARIVITLAHASFRFQATKPGESINDTGTYVHSA